MKAHIHLVRHCIAQGLTVSVFDGGEWQVKRSTDHGAIVGAIESVEEAEIVIRQANGDRVAWALVIPFGVDAWETVADHSATAFMDAWWAEFEAHHA